MYTCPQFGRCLWSKVHACSSPLASSPAPSEYELWELPRWNKIYLILSYPSSLHFISFFFCPRLSHLQLMQRKWWKLGMWETGNETTFHLQIAISSETVLPNWFLASTEAIYILSSNSPSASVMVIVSGLLPEGRNSSNLWGIPSGRVSMVL